MVKQFLRSTVCYESVNYPQIQSLQNITIYFQLAVVVWNSLGPMLHVIIAVHVYIAPAQSSVDIITNQTT
jgi:hypothetical protein